MYMCHLVSIYTSASKRPLQDIFSKYVSRPQHCAGIESILVSPEGGTLFTASRDATVRSWSGSGTALGQWRATFKGHSDWVTDAALVQDQLVTCSSDCCISVWDSQRQGQH